MKFMLFFIYSRVNLVIYIKFLCKIYEEVDFYFKNLVMIDFEFYIKWRIVIIKM